MCKHRKLVLLQRFLAVGETRTLLVTQHRCYTCGQVIQEEKNISEWEVVSFIRSNPNIRVVRK